MHMYIYVFVHIYMYIYMYMLLAFQIHICICCLHSKYVCVNRAALLNNCDILVVGKASTAADARYTVAVCCSALQCVTERALHLVLQRVAACCSLFDVSPRQMPCIFLELSARCSI